LKGGSVRDLSLTVEPRTLPVFYHFLQAGFFLEARVGLSIREFLHGRCELSPETIEDLISTVFLDGQPVDDLDRAIIGNGSTIALSGAMPGLMGATMRINSPYKSFRDSITHAGDEESRVEQQGLVRLKLFNTVMSELASRFLGEGILLEPDVVTDFLAKQAEKPKIWLHEILLDGESADSRLVLNEEALTGADLVSLSVRTRE
jgi:hypothetical protein